MTRDINQRRTVYFDRETLDRLNAYIAYYGEKNPTFPVPSFSAVLCRLVNKQLDFQKRCQKGEFKDQQRYKPTTSAETEETHFTPVDPGNPFQS
jgi:hypothetical protein